MTSILHRSSTKATSPVEPAATPPPRPRRRGWQVATAVVLGACGAIGGTLAWTSTSAMEPVLVAKQSLHRGDVIVADSFTTARTYADPSLDPVTPAELAGLVGTRLSLDVAAGSIVTHGAVTGVDPTRAGKLLVGVRLDTAHAPGTPLLVGDIVLAVVTPPSGMATDKAIPASAHAEVASVASDRETGDTVVDLLVSVADGPMIAANAAAGNVAVLLEARGGGN
ncbi:MAG: SAF domain-containing protein [Promicromonosporaceae bacterium]|nr:SAF domain-containing protein [Promicromonosporaceae bacterium]